MRKILYLVFAISSIINCNAQTTVTGDRIIARAGLYVVGTWLDSIQKSGRFDSDRTVPTSKAVAQMLKDSMPVIPTPGGNPYSIQYKGENNDLVGTGDLYYSPMFKNLTVVDNQSESSIGGNGFINLSNHESTNSPGLTLYNNDYAALRLGVGGSQYSQPEYRSTSFIQSAAPLYINSPKSIKIKAADSIMINPTPSAKADSVLGIINTQADGTSKMVKIPLPTKNDFVQAGGNAVINSTSEISMWKSSSGTYTIPASIWKPGKTYRFRLYFSYSTAASSSPTFTARIKFGSTNVWNSDAVTLGFNQSSKPLYYEVDIVCTSVGSFGNYLSIYKSTNDGVFTNPGPAIGFINTSNDYTLDITGQLSDATSGNYVTAYAIMIQEVY